MPLELCVVSLHVRAALELLNNKKGFSAPSAGIPTWGSGATAAGTESGSHTIPTRSSLHLIPQ